MMLRVFATGIIVMAVAIAVNIVVELVQGNEHPSSFAWWLLGGLGAWILLGDAGFLLHAVWS